MACRRRHGIARAATFKEDVYHPFDEGDSSSSSSLPSLAAQAIRASAADRDSSCASAYASNSAFHSSFKHQPKGGPTYDYTSMRSSNEGGSFWGVLARKAKAILDDDNMSPHSDTSLERTRPDPFDSSRGDQMDNPTLRKGLGAITSSLNNIGDNIVQVSEEGRTIVENKTADLIQESRKIQMRKEQINPGPWQQPTQPQNQTSREVQLKASRDVAMATAAKAKLLLRELKTIKADLAFAKQRCSQLEEENKVLREAREKGVNPADDDMIRRQLETLLAEKARLAHENYQYARENRILREIVEYHQLTMQDVVYLDEDIEEVTEVSPIPAVSRTLSLSPPSLSPRSSADISLSRGSSVAKEMLASLSRSSSVPTKGYYAGKKISEE